MFQEMEGLISLPPVKKISALDDFEEKIRGVRTREGKF